MANCCGGKNAGKPISTLRYMAGLGVFFGYHGVVATALHVVAVTRPELRRVRDFHRAVFLTEAVEVLQRRDINVNGPPPEQKLCEVPLSPSLAAAPSNGAPRRDAA